MDPINMRGLGIIVLAAFLSTSLMLGGSFAELKAAPPWNPTSAAAYLDGRARWWMAWPPAGREQQTFCISCHTALPYALARPALRTALGEKDQSEGERELLKSVTKRVRLWNEVSPFYNESSGANKTLQSRGTEAILNALILTSVDAASGKLSDVTRAALSDMWAVQQKTGVQKGAWPWLDFGNEPFEANDSQFYGASLAAVAVGTAPGSYRATPSIQQSLALLADYIRGEIGRAPLIHQTVSLWACTKWPSLLTAEQRQSVIDNVLSKQNSDGGWGLSSIGWTVRGSTLHSLVNLWVRSNDMPLAGRSDGYATGLIVFVLEQAGVPHEEIHLQRGRSWLVRNQSPTSGMWPGYSLVNRRDLRPALAFL